jgi:hypothetical protein
MKDSGIYEPHQVRKASCLGKFKNYLQLTFLGPLIFLIGAPFEMLRGIFLLPAYLIGGNSGFSKVDYIFISVIEKITGLSKNHLQDINQQRAVSQLFFETIPMLILQIFILVGLIHCPEIIEEGASAILLSFLTAMLNLV